jgi:glycerate 2-kinase
MRMANPRSALLEAFHAAVGATQPQSAVRQHLPAPAPGRTVVIAAGKAAATMLAALKDWHPVTGVAVTTAGQNLPDIPGVRRLEASHPLPDARSVAAGAAVLEAVRGLGSDDLVLCLISGGASALLCAPNGVTLPEKVALTNDLLRSGASIEEINGVRKHLSALKGGRLALAAQPAQVVSLIVSDVVGDDLAAIASGPTVPDPTTFEFALEVLNRYGIAVPEAILRGARGQLLETPKPGDPAFQRVENSIIVSNKVALEAAKRSLEGSGFSVVHIDDAIVGDSRTVAVEHAERVRKLNSGEVLLTGGETTVLVEDKGQGLGRGGRNLEYLLALAIADAGAWALACDSDGIDGSSSAAGAFVTPDTLERSQVLGLDAREFQVRHDAHGFFDALGDLIVTGPTGTNVNDLRIVLKPA